MKRSSPLLMSIISAMVITQGCFTLLVYRSNRILYDSARMILDAGYLAVPNASVLPSLLNPYTAILGALFFTLTLGIAVPILIQSACRVLRMIPLPKRFFPLLLIGIALYGLFRINENGANPIVSIWLGLTLLSTVLCLPKTLPPFQKRLFIRACAVHIPTLVLLAAILSTQGGTQFFTTFRNQVLLPHPAGAAVSDFYYRYTSYPTEAVKPLSNKQQKLYSIEGTLPDRDMARIKRILLREDYLPTASTAPDVRVLLSGDRISFRVGKAPKVETDIAAFLRDPDETLRLLSDRSDRQKATRRLIGVSIQYILPLACYALLFWGLHGVLKRFLPGTPGMCVAALTLPALFFLFMWQGAFFTPPLPVSTLPEALASPNLSRRVAALRTLTQEGLDPADFTQIPDIAPSFGIAERMAWAMALSSSRHRDADPALLRLADDPQPNVACMAYRSLGIRGERRFVTPVLEAFSRLTHWYVQEYAYQALRRMGWQPTESPTKP